MQKSNCTLPPPHRVVRFVLNILEETARQSVCSWCRVQLHGNCVFWWQIFVVMSYYSCNSPVARFPLRDSVHYQFFCRFQEPMSMAKYCPILTHGLSHGLRLPPSTTQDWANSPSHGVLCFCITYLIRVITLTHVLLGRNSTPHFNACASGAEFNSELLSPTGSFWDMETCR